MKFIKRTENILLTVLIILVLFYYGATFFIPFSFGVFLAMLMTPLSNLFERYKIHSVLASFLSTIIVFIGIGVISYLFIYQISLFAQDLPKFREEAGVMIENFQKELSSNTGLTLEEQDHIIESRTQNFLGVVEKYIANLFSSTLDFLFNLILLFIYVFLFLVYRNKIKKFFIMLYRSKEKKGNAEDIINKVSKIVYHYLWGRLQVMSILAVMYYITFSIFDLPYAILLTIFGALITIIPYIGPLLSGVMPVLFSLLYFEDPYTIVLFAAIVLVEQLIESYVLEPLIIGKEVQINPLAVIIAIIIGGMIWGIAGMILFVPLFAAIKIICNHHEKLKPIGYLLGNERN